jgi:hypothetical protein
MPPEGSTPTELTQIYPSADFPRNEFDRTDLNIFMPSDAAVNVSELLGKKWRRARHIFVRAGADTSFRGRMPSLSDLFWVCCLMSSVEQQGNTTTAILGARHGENVLLEIIAKREGKALICRKVTFGTLTLRL